MDERTDIINKVRNYRDLINKSDFPMKIDATYLFGSYAKGNPHKDSDIDVAFVVNQWRGDYMEVMPLIWKIRRDVDMRIEPHVIVSKEDYAGFLNEIKRTGLLIK
ncbi:MAG: nucleotidyltransferase domain-containing protein [Tannerella sp.]|jgi:predicted nucleotidyltransferase|nr:nucleotidyltransferase domain-containing protein [Tannerella sp.]